MADLRRLIFRVTEATLAATGGGFPDELFYFLVESFIVDGKVRELFGKKTNFSPKSSYSRQKLSIFRPQNRALLIL